MQNIKKSVLALFVIEFAYVFYYSLSKFDFFIEFNDFQSQKCEVMMSAVGPEDMITFNDTLIFSNYNKGQQWIYYESSPFQTTNGSIHVIYPPYQQIKQLNIDNFPPHYSFKPFGINYYQNRLFVINEGYRKGGENVEIFQIQKDILTNELKLKYEHSLFFDSQFHGILNSIQPISATEFFVDSYRAYPDFIGGRQQTSLSNKIKNVFAALFQKQTFVYYCNLRFLNKGFYYHQDNCVKLDETAAGMNNGIALETKNNRLYVSDSVNKQINVYEIQNNTQINLHLVKQIHLDFYPDNLRYDDEKQQIIAAGINQKFSFLVAEYHLQNSKEGILPDSFQSWGSICVIDINTYESTILMRQNDKIREITVASRVNQFYFAGSWADNRILKCKF